MKKSVVAILLCVYLVVTSGVIVNLHYCMNRFASAQWFGTDSKECGKCGMHIEDSNGCCRDEVKIVKMDEDQRFTADASVIFYAPEALVQTPSVFISTSFYNGLRKQDHLFHPPPLLSAQDTYLQNGVFRI